MIFNYRTGVSEIWRSNNDVHLHLSAIQEPFFCLRIRTTGLLVFDE